MSTISAHPQAEIRILTFADRVSIHEAKRQFDAGGAILVSEYGRESRQPVYPDTTFHTRESTDWAQLSGEVREWRGRYPHSRFYVLRPVSIPDTAGELVALLKDHALSISGALIDENVVEEEHLRASSLAWKLSRLLTSAVALTARD